MVVRPAAPRRARRRTDVTRARRPWLAGWTTAALLTVADARARPPRDGTTLVAAAPVTGEAPSTEGPKPEGDAPAEAEGGAEIVADDLIDARDKVRTRAEQVSFDARLKTLDLSGNVRVDAAPFHLRSDRITLARTRWGIEFDGAGRLAFCPCLGTPLSVAFDHAIVAPPGDLILRNPTLRLYGVPVFYLPYFWLRSDEKIGLLPPDVAWRGQDGLFLGGGLHVPWRQRGEKTSIDVRAGGYLVRGFAVEAKLRTADSANRVRFDTLDGASSPRLLGREQDDQGTRGLTIDARGASNGDAFGIAWDVDAIRGRRGVVSTTDLDAAAKPWDRGAVETAAHVGPVTFATGVRAVTRRGGDLSDLDAIGPVARARASGAVLEGVAYDASVEGGALRISDVGATLLDVDGKDTLSFVRAEAGALGATHVGPVGASLSLRGVGNLAQREGSSGSSGTASARAQIGVPLVRAFHTDDPTRDPWVHTLEPKAEAAVLTTGGDGSTLMLPGRGYGGTRGTVPVLDGGIVTALGRWGARRAIEVEVKGGAALQDARVARGLARARIAGSLTWFGASGEGAWVFGSSAPHGAVGLGRVRLGREDAVRILTNVAVRDGVDPVLARALTDAPFEPSTSFLTRDGVTGGSSLIVPWSRFVTTSVGADGDAKAAELIAVKGGLELRDRCGCLAFRAAAAHRIGRSGVDVWVALDFVADR